MDMQHNDFFVKINVMWVVCNLHGSVYTDIAHIVNCIIGIQKTTHDYILRYEVIIPRNQCLTVISITADDAKYR